MREPDVAAEVRRLIAATPAALPDLIAAILAERAADAYFLHGTGGATTAPGGGSAGDAEAVAADA